MDMASIKKMTLVERLQAMELLWESLSQNEHELESPEWHQKILAERKENIDSKKLIPLSEVKKNFSR